MDFYVQVHRVLNHSNLNKKLQPLVRPSMHPFGHVGKVCNMPSAPKFHSHSGQQKRVAPQNFVHKMDRGHK
jgi:hypothetical protein